jgi:hypothetical protein
MRNSFTHHPPHLQDVAPQWQAVMDSLHRMLALLHAANRAIPDELRVLVPMDFPPPYPNMTMPVATIFMVRIEYTDAVTRPVLGHVLNPAST